MSKLYLTIFDIYTIIRNFKKKISHEEKQHLTFWGSSLLEAHDLVLHQGDKRGENHCCSLCVHRGVLVTQTFTITCNTHRTLKDIITK